MAPVNAARIENENTRWTHEVGSLPISLDRLNFQAGMFYEDFEIKHVGDFNYQAPIDAGFAGIDINSSSTFDKSEANARGRVIPILSSVMTIPVPKSKPRSSPNSPTKSTTILQPHWRRPLLRPGLQFHGLRCLALWQSSLFVDDADPSNDIRPTMTGGRDYQANFEGLQPLNVSDTFIALALRGPLKVQIR